MPQLSPREALTLRAKIDKFSAWMDTRRGKNGLASYRPEDVPPSLEQVSNAERSALEVYDWRNSPRAERYVCYLSGDGKQLTTWTGDELATVTRETTSRTGFHGSTLTHIRAIAPDGSTWYGKGAGRGMCIMIRRAKAATLPRAK